MRNDRIETIKTRFNEALKEQVELEKENKPLRRRDLLSRAKEKLKYIAKKNLDRVLTIISYGLCVWLFAGLLGFWQLLPGSKTWTIIKIVSVVLLTFILLMRAEEASDEPFKKQLLIAGKYILGALALFAFFALLYFIFGFSFNGFTERCYPYPWETRCP